MSARVFTKKKKKKKEKKKEEGGKRYGFSPKEEVIKSFYDKGTYLLNSPAIRAVRKKARGE